MDTSEFITGVSISSWEVIIKAYNFNTELKQRYRNVQEMML